MGNGFVRLMLGYDPEQEAKADEMRNQLSAAQLAAAQYELEQQKDEKTKTEYWQQQFKDLVENRIPKQQQAVSDTTALNPVYYTETELNSIAKYRVYGDATYLNQLTGEEFTKWSSFYIDVGGNKAAMREHIMDEVAPQKYEEGVTMIGFNQMGVEHNQGLSY